MSYSESNGSEKQNTVIDEESTTITSTTEAPSITTTTRGIQAGTQLNYQCNADQIEYTTSSRSESGGSELRSAYTQTAETEILAPATDIIFGVSSVIATAVSEDVVGLVDRANAANRSHSSEMSFADAEICADAMQQQSNNLLRKQENAPSTDIAAPNVGDGGSVLGDGMRMSNFAKVAITSATTIATTTNVTTVSDASLATFGRIEATTTTISKPHIPFATNSSATTLTLPTTAVVTAKFDAPHLTHTSSDPTIGMHSQLLRNQQQHKMKSYHDTKQTTVWSKDSVLGSRDGISIDATIQSAIAVTTTKAATTFAGAVIKSGAYSTTVSPCSVRKCSDPNSALPRRVSFPKSDNELVTGYLEPANPWEQACLVKCISEIAELYVMSCRKHNTKPLQTVLDHLKGVELNKQQRQPVLSLKSIKLTASDCEALEEIFKRVQYKFIDLSSCDLDEWATSALFEMIEYYEATNELDISSNSKGMTNRGWSGCMYMVSHSEELRVLIAHGNPISKQSADGLGQAISTSNLHTLKLEHCGLKGALAGLCFKLRHNTILKELWLAHNDLDCKDAEAIGDLLKVNHYLELIDISNNNIRDEGLLHIVEALILQSNELERRSMLQRSSAIDDDDSLSSIEASQMADFDTSEILSSSGKSSSEEDVGNSVRGDNTTDMRHTHTSVEKSSNVFSTILTTDKVSNENVLPQQYAQPETTAIAGSSTTKNSTIIATAPVVTLLASLDEMDGDDDTEDTVKSTNQKNGTHAPTSGQSMLDKLLSMNSESSSEDGASNLSTDTIAACGSEDASVISDDIFDTTTAAGATGALIDTNRNKNTNAKATNEAATALITNISIVACHDEVTDKRLAAGMDAMVASRVGEVTGEELMLIDITSKIEANSTINDNSSNSCSCSTEVNITNSNSNSECVLTMPSSSDISNCNNNIANSTTSDVGDVRSVDRQHKDAERQFIPDQDKQNQNQFICQQQHTRLTNDSLPNAVGIFEVTAGEGDCTIASAPEVLTGSVDGGRLLSDHTAAMLEQQLPSKAVDVNKNTKLTDDYDDTHSTDSAFESASEGDISRHLPEEYSRLSSSFDGTRMDDIAKGVAIETGTIATESIEYLAETGVTSTLTPSSELLTARLDVEDIEVNCRTITPNTSFSPDTYAGVPQTIIKEKPVSVPTAATVAARIHAASVEEKRGYSLNELLTLPKVTIATDGITSKDKETLINSPIPTPTPPSNSPSGTSPGMRRTESANSFITPATRHRSQSSDSLCSDNSLDGSISSDLNFSISSQLNEKLTKNDTLTRQQRPMDTRGETAAKAPAGLKALALWNNNLTKEAGHYIAHLLAETNSLELLNIGKNCLSNEFVSRIKDNLIRNTTLTTLGLQSAHLSANGIETLASILTFGGNSTLQRLDIRDNKLEVESLSKIAEVLKSNTTITQIDIDDEPKRLSVGSEAHMDYTRVLENVRSMCSRNEKTQTQLQSDKTLNSSCSTANKRRGGYYVGSRKISLTCHTRPLIETTTSVLTTSTLPVSAVNTKLDAKRKTGARLRSPVPSPPTVSPSSSPNRSRFQVFRVKETSPLTSPMPQTPSSAGSSTSSLTMNSYSSSVSMPTNMPYKSSVSAIAATSSFPTSSSLPSMATVTSSTQSVKRLSASPRSRFLVSKIYEDPRVPLASRSLPPITPPIHLPPTPIAKHAPVKVELMPLSVFNTTPTVPAATIDAKAPDDTREIYNLNIDTVNSNSSGSSSSAAKATTVIITPPTPAIAVTTADSTGGTNIHEFSHNIKLKQLNSTNATIQMQTQQQQHQPEQQKDQQCPEQGPQTPPTNQQQQQQVAQNTYTTSSTTTINSNISSLSPNCSSSSSSSSTSPASLQSNSSSTSTSSSLSAIFSSSSPDSTDSIGGGGAGGGGELSLRDELLNATASRCPLAVFNDTDNDITLTKNSASDLTTPATSTVASSEELQQRQRKVSWIANPGAVDKLRSLFFQRSSSPENKPQTSAAIAIPATVVTSSTISMPSTTTTTIAITNAQAFKLADCTLTDAATHQLIQQQQSKQKQEQQQQQQNLSMPSLCAKLGTEILGNTNSAGLVTNAANATLEQSRSFFEAASQQLRDLSKQVFRQNLSFGNEAATSGAADGLTSVGDGGSSSVGGGTNITGGAQSPEQHDATYIPTEVKQEIKENISPEHTINEETLHSLQKLTGIEDAVRTVQQHQQQVETAAVAAAGALLEEVGATTITIIPAAVLEECNANRAGNTVAVSSACTTTSAVVSVTPTPALVKEEPTMGSAATKAAAST